MIALIRSTDGNPDSRFEKYINFLESKGVKHITLCWDRNLNKEESEFKRYYKKQGAYNKRYGNVGSLLGFSRYLFKELRRLKDEYSVIHACDFDTVLPAVLMHIFYGKKVIYDVFDWYVDSRNIKGLIKYIFYALEYINIKCADAVIVCEPEREKQIMYKPSKLWVLPNIPNFSTLLPTNPPCKKLTLGYVGILGKGRGIGHLIEYAHKHPEVNIKIAGFGPLADLLTDASMYPNIQYFGSVKYVDALNIMNSSDIVMAIYEKINKNQILAAPNKYYEGLYLGKPIITTVGTIVGDKTIIYNTGYVIDEKYEDFEKLVDSINPNDLKEKTENARKLWASKFSTYIQDFLDNTYLPYIQSCNK